MQVYVEGITKELATEIKSELRGVIAQVEDVLSESIENDYDKKGTFDYHNVYKRKAFSLPISVNSEDQNIDSSQKSRQMNFQKKQMSPKLCCTHSSLPNTISAERFSEFLVGFTSDVVSEMKSEFRDVVNAVDGLISPSPAATDEKSKSTPPKKVEKNDKTVMKLVDGEKGTVYFKNILSSQDSGINLTDRDLSPSELSERKPIKSFCDSEEKYTDSEQSSITKVPIPDYFWHLPPKNIWNPTCEVFL